MLDRLGFKDGKNFIEVIFLLFIAAKQTKATAFSHREKPAKVAWLPGFH